MPFNYTRNNSVAPFDNRIQMDMMKMLQGCNGELYQNLLNTSNPMNNILDFGQTPTMVDSSNMLSTLKQNLERALNLPSLQNAETRSVSDESHRKRNKPDNEFSTGNPLFKSPKKDEDFKSKMSEGLLKISDFQNDDQSESSGEEADKDIVEADKGTEEANKGTEEANKGTEKANKGLDEPDKSLPGTPKSDAKSIASIDVASMQDAAADAVDVPANDHLMKEIEDLKSKVLKLENDLFLENQKNGEEMNELRRQLEESNKKYNDLCIKIEKLENEKALKIPTMEDFENLRKKVEDLEQGYEPLKTKNDGKGEKDNMKTEPKEKEDPEKNLSDIDMCILNLSQTINSYFKKLAGRLMSGQKEKEEELMMERLRSLEPVQAVIYEKLRWILSMGNNPNNEGALRSAAKVSKHFPFLLAFLGFNYHDLIMMSIGMDGEISQADGAMRLAKWFNNILKEKTEDNKRIWPSSVSTNMLASILTERFSSTAKQNKGLKMNDSTCIQPTINPMIPTNTGSISRNIAEKRPEKEISIVGEFSQNNKREAHFSKLDANTYGKTEVVNQSFPSLMDMRSNCADMRTLGTTQQSGNRANESSFPRHLPRPKDGLGIKRNRF